MVSVNGSASNCVSHPQEFVLLMRNFLDVPQLYIFFLLLRSLVKQWVGFIQAMLRINFLCKPVILATSASIGVQLFQAFGEWSEDNSKITMGFIRLLDVFLSLRKQ